MKPKQVKIDRKLARKVLEVVDAGLVNGLGSPIPGQMCVEAAVCYAMGLPHNDDPPCVGSAVRSFKIVLNDAGWSSNKARAKGMRRVAIAQLGSEGIDQKAFSAFVTEQTIRRILPIALRAAANLIPAHAKRLEQAAVRCETEGSKEAVAYAASAAAANAVAYAATNASANAANAAANAAYAAARAAARAAADAAANAAAYAASAAARAANADAAAYAAYDATAADEVLSLAVNIAAEALAKLKSQGVEFLDLCK